MLTSQSDPSRTLNKFALRPVEHSGSVPISLAYPLINKALFNLFRIPDCRSLEAAKVGIHWASMAGAVLIKFYRLGQRILDVEPLIVRLRRNWSISYATPPLEGVMVNPNSKVELTARDGFDWLNLGEAALVKAD